MDWNWVALFRCGALVHNIVVLLKYMQLVPPTHLHNECYVCKTLRSHVPEPTANVFNCVAARVYMRIEGEQRVLAYSHRWDQNGMRRTSGGQALFRKLYCNQIELLNLLLMTKDQKTSSLGSYTLRTCLIHMFHRMCLKLLSPPLDPAQCKPVVCSMLSCMPCSFLSRSQRHAYGLWRYSCGTTCDFTSDYLAG